MPREHGTREAVFPLAEVGGRRTSRTRSPAGFGHQVPSKWVWSSRQPSTTCAFDGCLDWTGSDWIRGRPSHCP